jgi:choline-sulfatase
MKDETRREFLKKGLTVMGGAVASGVLGNATPGHAAKRDAGGAASKGRGAAGQKRPNIVLIITDQQRQAQHWPDGWIEAHMPTMKRLQESGVTFTNNFPAATACAPSRASFLTGVYPTVHGCTDTPPNPRMRSDITNIFKLAEQAGYEVAYKGKAHLFTPQSNPSTDNFTSYDIKWASDNYRMNRWNPPDDSIDAGASVWMAGGWPNNDARYVSGVPDTYNRMTPPVPKGESIFEYLDNYDPKADKPFLLVCSFGNPHDISIWPDQTKWGYNEADYKKLKEIGLPSNYKDDLKEKPIGQTWIQKLCDKAFPCSSTQDRIDYCRFYAHLHSVVDKQIAAVLDKLDDKGLTDDTIIFRFADHGEQSFSHGMQQKSLNCYQESINVPMIISNPKLFPKGTTTSSFSSLIDLVPTVAEITGAASPEELKRMGICGKSLVPIMKDPNASVRDNIMLYTEDCEYFFDKFLGKKNFYATMPGRIRCIRFEDWMYAVYFTDKGTKIQYEMYNMTDDPGQLKNLAWGSRQKANLKQMQNLHDRLTAELETYQALPTGFQWPAKAGTESV